MRFDVPQFIDVEDKIFGPLTFRQFVYLVGGGGLAYIFLKLLPIYFGILLAAPIAALAIVLAFIKYNGKPFINIIEYGFNYTLRNKLYLWKKEVKKKKVKTDAEKEAPQKPHVYIPTITESKLHDISWGLDVLDSKKSSF